MRDSEIDDSVLIIQELLVADGGALHEPDGVAYVITEVGLIDRVGFGRCGSTGQHRVGYTLRRRRNDHVGVGLRCETRVGVDRLVLPVNTDPVVGVVPAHVLSLRIPAHVVRHNGYRERHDADRTVVIVCVFSRQTGIHHQFEGIAVAGLHGVVVCLDRRQEEGVAVLVILLCGRTLIVRSVRLEFQAVDSGTEVRIVGREEDHLTQRQVFVDRVDRHGYVDGSRPRIGQDDGGFDKGLLVMPESAYGNRHTAALRGRQRDEHRRRTYLHVHLEQLVRTRSPDREGYAVNGIVFLHHRDVDIGPVEDKKALLDQIGDDLVGARRQADILFLLDNRQLFTVDGAQRTGKAVDISVIDDSVFGVKTQYIPDHLHDVGVLVAVCSQACYVRCVAIEEPVVNAGAVDVEWRHAVPQERAFHQEGEVI